MTNSTGCGIRQLTFFSTNPNCGPELRRGMMLHDFQTAFGFLLSSVITAFPSYGKALKASGYNCVSLFTANSVFFFVR